ncbi:MAG: M24 family metallopeptidase [Flavobacteriaceae bacterium]|nr:MAG: M24 family metallopeptidase [Flavobacteriaceae bacterium]
MRLLALLSVISVSFTANIVAQTPTDYLSKDFHKQKRTEFRNKMAANSVAVFFANPFRNRANDVDYIYHQDPNFYYLTGYREPNAVLVIYSENLQNKEGAGFNEVLYVQKKDPNAEMWNGRRLGVAGAKKELGFGHVYNAIEFINTTIHFKKFDKVYIEAFKDDYRNTGNKAEVFDLVKSFKTKSGYDPNVYLSQAKKYVYEMVKETPVENSVSVARIIGRIEAHYSEIKEDQLLMEYKAATDAKLKGELKQKIALKLIPKTNIDIRFLENTLAEMREVKSPEEIKLLTKAIRISAVGQIEVMKAMKPHMSETELQGIHEFVYKKYGAEYEGYPSIVGAGNNGCILHYIENNKTKVGNDLVLMDLGAEYRGYTADVTRTIPANGKFTPEQKAIYDIVYDAQEAGIKASVVGAPFGASNNAARKVINEGLFHLGIIKTVDERHHYLPHGTTHYIGLDVHDPGTYGPFKTNSIITVEPGIYIPEGSPCDKKWWGIAVRIEDDILITENGPVNLSAEAPRKSSEIEKMMAQKSVLDAFVLPDLD